MTASDSSESDFERLANLIGELGVHATAEQVGQLDRYRQALWAWNERMNLTRHTTVEKFVTRDVWDSWQLCEQIDRGERILDVGTGGGVPGLILAILRPDLTVAVCESTRKKSQAVTAIVEELELPIVVHACRAEDVLEMSTFDVLVARGVAPLEKLLRWFAPHWDSFDQLLLVKGRSWVEERGRARHLGLLKDFEIRKVSEYVTPRTDAVSVILKLWRPASG